ncbi:tripartite motif-containing protein 55-like isoform X2 [Saccostrea cucullata]|uniref:tripartite motif-containing protein 55-like isoform X2 n=1 Tax=Saccostrea cuccullata TaxID=36930 RepID=UPI002ED468DF
MLTMANVCKAQDVVRCQMCCSNGEFRCHSCSINLCESCVGKHMSSTVNKLHDVASLIFKKIDQSKFPMCFAHGQQKCEMFCSNCDVSVCSKCITSGKHKSHDVKDFLECVTERKSMIERAKHDVTDTVIPTFEKMKDRVDKKLNCLDDEFDDIEEKINDNGRKWHKLVDSVVEDNIEDARKMKRFMQKCLMSKQVDLQSVLENLEDFLRGIGEVLESFDALEVLHFNVDIQHLLENVSKIQIRKPTYSGKIISEDELKQNFGAVSSPIQTTFDFAVRCTDPEARRSKSFCDSKDDGTSSSHRRRQTENEQSLESAKLERLRGKNKGTTESCKLGTRSRLSDSNLYRKNTRQSRAESRFSVCEFSESTFHIEGFKPLFPVSPSMIRLEDVVEFERYNGLRGSGIVKYAGRLKDRDGIYIGVELDSEGDGKHDGMIEGVRYFKCKHNKGMFIKFDKVFNVWKKIEK